jgi:hypothetical protein
MFIFTYYLIVLLLFENPNGYVADTVGILGILTTLLPYIESQLTSSLPSLGNAV